MAKSEDKERLSVVDPEDGETSEQAPAIRPAQSSPAPGPQAVQTQVILDDSQAMACYANFCRVTGTPEEVIMDLGLNSQPFGVPQSPVKVTQRLILNYFTAKRLLAALSMTVQRHEQAFGVLETDVQKRVRNRGGS